MQRAVILQCHFRSHVSCVSLVLLQHGLIFGGYWVAEFESDKEYGLVPLPPRCRSTVLWLEEDYQ